MPKTARIVIIGAGWWAGDYHIPGTLAHPEAELAGLCDPDPTRLANAAQAYGITRTYADYRAMLDREQPDAAIVVTPHATHYSIARDCLERGLHVLIEKPMTLRASEARELVELAAQRGREIMIGYTWNEYPHVRRARQAFLGGELGQIQYVASSFSSGVIQYLKGNVSASNAPSRFKINPPGPNYNQAELPGGGGQGHLQLTHSIAMLLFATGLRPRRVQAMMSRFGLPVDLVDAISVEFDGGALGMLGGTGNAGANYRMALAVYATGGCYIADSLARFATLRRFDGQEEPLTWDKDAEPGSEYAVTRNFMDAILGRPTNRAPGELGWRVVEILDAAYRSSANGGQPVNIEDLYKA